MKFRFPSSEERRTIPAPLSDIEIARMWRGLAATPLPQPRRRSMRPTILLGVGLAAVAAAVAFVVALALSPSEEMVGNDSVTDESLVGADRGELELPDGSRLTYAPDTRLKLISATADDIELMLLRGTVEMTIANALPETRRFLVAAGDFDVITRGGRLRITAGDAAGDRRLEVSVLAGQAEVHRHSAERTTVVNLAAGESWANDFQAAARP
jgi:ferric-dicitrate binding protein FerR (iron transport regulator)